MDVINTLVQENKAFAEKLEEQFIRGQLVEKMLVNAQKVMTGNTQEIQGLKQQLSLKENVLHQAEMEISLMKRTYDGSMQDNMSSVSLGSQADELKQLESLRVSEEGLPLFTKDKDRERDAQLGSLKEDIRALREENQSLQTLFTNTENGNTPLKESFSQTQIIRLQGELQDLQRLQLKDMPSESPHSGLKSPVGRHLGLDDSFLWMQLDEGDRSPSSSSSTSQCRAEKQVLSGTATPDDCLSIRSLSSRVSVQGPGDLCASPKTAAPAREHSALQRHISEAQTLIMEVDTCIQDSFQTRVQEDVLTRAVIESLMQQNQAVAQELDLQTARVHELEVMLADAFEQKAVAVSESQTAMEELQDFIRGRDKLLKELSEDYSQLREEKIHLQSFFCDDGHGTAVLKKSFHQSHPQINKMQGEITELHRRQHTSSLSKLYLGLKAHEERELSPQDVASVVLDLNEFSSFLGGTLDEQHQNSAPEPGPAAAEGATRLRKEYKTQTFKV